MTVNDSNPADRLAVVCVEATGNCIGRIKRRHYETKNGNEKHFNQRRVWDPGLLLIVCCYSYYLT